MGAVLGLLCLGCAIAAQAQTSTTLVLGRVSDDPKAHYERLRPLLDYVVAHMADLGIREGRLAVHLGEQAMMIGGDILLEMCGITVRPGAASVLEMQRQLNALRSGEALKVKVWRSGQVLELITTIP